MTVVSITQAAKLVRRGRASMYRDIEKGVVSKTVSPSGETGIDTSELLRAYGRLYQDDTNNVSIGTSAASQLADFEMKVDGWTHGRAAPTMSQETSGDTLRLTVLEVEMRARDEKIAQLERIVSLERESRQLAAASMRRELDGKDQVIRLLENQILMLEYTAKPTPDSAAATPTTVPTKGFWARLFS